VSRVLILEHNKRLCLLYAHELRAEGYEVILATNGDEALEQIESKHPDIVITDVVMERSHVLTALRRRESLPVILNTSYDDSAEELVPWLADVCITKSSDLSELKGKIRDLLAQPGRYQHEEVGTC
jgi:DNA-binding response OmpR family regulator